MNSFLLACNVVLPIFFILMIGQLLRQLKILDLATINVLNKIVFNVFMSSLLFLNIYNIGSLDFMNKNNAKFMLFPIVFVFGMIFFAYLVFHSFVKDKRQLSVMIQGSFRSNFIMYGISIAESLYGSLGLQTVSLLPIVVIPTFNICAVLILEYYSGQSVKISKLIKSTVKNPLIISSVLAFIFLKFNIKLHFTVYKTLSDLAKVTTPIAFIILGAKLEFQSFKNNFAYIMSVNFLRLILFPGIIILIAKYLNFSSEQIVSYLCVTAAPTAVASFTMAKEMGADSDLAGEIVVSTTAFSVFTVFLWIVVLKTLSWI